MTPSQYKARYENLTVPLDTGGSTTIRLNQYRLRPMNYNETAAKAFLNKFDRNGVDMELRVDSGPETFRIAHRQPDGSTAEPPPSMIAPSSFSFPRMYERPGFMSCQWEITAFPMKYCERSPALR